MAHKTNGEVMAHSSDTKDIFEDPLSVSDSVSSGFTLSPYLEFFTSRPLIKFKDFLQARFLYLTGARDCGHPVLIVDANILKSSGLHSHPSFKSFLSSFIRLCSQEYIDVGITVILDLRIGGTNAAKTFMNLLKNDALFPVHDIIVIKPKISAFSATPALVGIIKVKYVKDIITLTSVVIPNNLTVSLGGTLKFDYDHWLLILQLFQDNIQKTSNLLNSMNSLLSDIQNLDYNNPATINKCPTLMTTHFAQGQELTHGFMDVTYGLTEFSNLLEKITLDQSPISCTPGLWDLYCKMEGLRRSVKKKDSYIQEVFRVHQDKMRNCVKACELKLMVISVNKEAENGLEELQRFQLKFPDSFDNARELGEEFERVSPGLFEKVEHEILAIEREVEYLTTRNLHSEYYLEYFQILKENFSKLYSLIQNISSNFMEFTDYFYRAQVIQEWCQHLKGTLASSSLAENNPKGYVKKLNKWIHDTHSMMGEKVSKQASLLPGTHVKEHYKILRGDVDMLLSELEQRKTGIEAALKSRSAASTNFLDKILKPSSRKHDKPIANTNNSNIEPSGPFAGINPFESISTLSLLSNDDETDKKVIVQRQYIFKEILETERTYCNDLKYVIDNFVNDVSDKCPDTVVTHKDIIFSNIEELFSFHNDVFLEELRKFMDTPQNIGLIFVKQKYNFQLYSTYCKNRPQCENFLSQHPELLDYFQKKQLSFNNRLPFLSYLIKPIQRITKYQLLLRDMTKNSAKAPDAHLYLREAIECMLKILKNLNDTLYINAIKHFPCNILEQGQLLHQDVLRIKLLFNNKTKLAISKVRFSNQQVFLFEKSIVFTKKQKLSQNLNDLTQDNIYLYKSHIMTSEIILRENIPGNALSFEIIVHKQNCSYFIVVSDTETKTKWLQSLNVLLQLQFSKMRERVIHETGISGPQGLSKAVVEHGIVRLESTTSDVPASPTTSVTSVDATIWDDSPVHTTIKHKSAIHRKTKSVVSALEQSRPPSIGLVVTPANNSSQTDDSLDPGSGGSSSGDEGRLSFTEGLQKPLFAEDENLLVGSLRTYRIQKDYKPNAANPHGIKVKAGQSVMVLGLRPNGLWWVRTLPPSPMVEGWLPQEVLNPSISPANKLLI